MVAGFAISLPKLFFFEVMFLKGQFRATRLVPDGMHGHLFTVLSNKK
jgi:hypothetical protein